MKVRVKYKVKKIKTNELNKPTYIKLKKGDTLLLSRLKHPSKRILNHVSFTKKTVIGEYIGKGHVLVQRKIYSLDEFGVILYRVKRPKIHYK